MLRLRSVMSFTVGRATSFPVSAKRTRTSWRIAPVVYNKLFVSVHFLFDIPGYSITNNGPFYSCVRSCLAFE